MELFKFRNKFPEISEGAYIQEGVKICGDVKIETKVSIWYNCTIRADLAPVVLKEGCNVQELSTIHTDHNYPTTIGSNTTIGHNCIIHGATIGNDALIGMGAIILNGAKIGDNCLVGAGSLVTQGSEFEDGMLIMGSPAKAIRKIKDSELKYIKQNAREYVELSQEYLKGFE